jgi:uncharacterized protein YggE
MEADPNSPQSVPSSTPPAGPSRPVTLYALFAILAVGIFALGALTFGAFGGPRDLSVTIANPSAGTGLTVQGSATVHAVPDMATLTLGISSTGATVKSVRANTALAAQRVLGALHAAGVVDADIATTNISLYENSDYTKTYGTQCGGVVYPQTAPSTGSGSVSSSSAGGGTNGTSSAASPAIVPMPPIPVPSAIDTAPPASAEPSSPIVAEPSAGVIMPIETSGPCAWVYSEDFVVSVRDIDATSGVLDGAIAAGATSVGGISFDTSSRSNFEGTARTAAVADAHTQAAQLAAAAGVTLGAPISITTTISGGYYAPLAAAAANSTTSTPVEAGTLDITASVTVVYALK